jgi:hypothetical protein
VTGADPEDDPSIAKDDQLWRRIPPRHWIDCPGEHCRPSSQTYEDDEDGSLSVDIGRLTTPEAILVGHDGYAVASFTAGLARECGLTVVGDPQPLDPAHALVMGNKSGSRRKALVRGSVWVVPPQV